MAFEDGQSFFRSAVDRLERGEEIDLVIIDIDTPVVDGVSAARMFRALEEKHGRERIPIVFFSRKRPDDSLRERMSSCRPVRYLNKGGKRRSRRTDEGASRSSSPARHPFCCSKYPPASSLGRSNAAAYSAEQLPSEHPQLSCPPEPVDGPDLPILFASHR